MHESVQLVILFFEKLDYQIHSLSTARKEEKIILNAFT